LQVFRQTLIDFYLMRLHKNGNKHPPCKPAVCLRWLCASGKKQAGIVGMLGVSNLLFFSQLLAISLLGYPNLPYLVDDLMPFYFSASFLGQ